MIKRQTMRLDMRGYMIILAMITTGYSIPFAQHKITIQGKVVDDVTQDPLEFTALSLITAVDSTLVTGTISDLNGVFSLEATPGTYHLKAEFISYQESWIENILITPDQKITDLGVLRLHISAAMLEEVEVTGEKSQFQLGLDKKIFNVDKDLVTRGGSAADVLDNIPSVSVDIDGNVSLRGSQNVRILVDGRPSGLVGLSDNNALKSLRGDMIERVEVVTNPSARYDAEGMAGIINIVLKKDQQKGFNGSFGATAGYPANFGGSANVNYRKKNLNFFVNYGMQYNRSPGGGNLYQEYYYGDTTLYLEQTRDRTRGGLSHNVRFGTDYYFNEKNVLTGAFLYRMSDEDNESSLIYRDFDQFRELTSVTLRDETEEENSPTIEYSLNYKRNFKKEDHVFTANIQYNDNSEVETSSYLEQFLNPDFTPSEIPDLHQRSRNEEGNISWTGQMDYVLPFSKESKFETGYKASIREIRTFYLVEELRDDVWETLDDLTNRFLYDEDIHAAYLIYGNKTGRFSYQTGLRAEYSHVITELLETSEINDRDYLDIFPSVHFGYELQDQNTFQISYSRRVNRPRFHMLNPFFTYSDSRNRWGGNPNLEPEYTNSLELGHIKYWEKASLTSSIYYRHSNNVVERIRTISEGITETRPQNLSERDDYGFEFTFAKDLLKAWKVDGNLNLFRSITDGGQFGGADVYNWSTRLNSRVVFFDKLETQVRLNYRGPQETTQGRNKASFHTDFGMSTDLIQGRATLTLNVSDIFNTRKHRYVTEGDGFYSEGDFQWRARQITLNFTYRLNQRKEKRERPESERSGEDEMFQG
ncbi:MAG TPA: outer membrane beta-barrel family protein [Saprospiraceae bacterium]|nr:outer membrane beta-barrel family protein [Saprospiraceae bacterium]